MSNMSKEVFLKELKLGIGGIGISITSPNSEKAFEVDETFGRFITPGKPDVILHLHDGNIPRVESGRKIFDGSIWKLYHNNGKYLLGFYFLDSGPFPYKVAVLALDFKSGDIYTKNDGFDHDDFPNPLTYPLGEILMINLLSLKRGMMIHACGIKINGKGIIFAGSSGEGKSTLANLCSEEKDVMLLNDDRIIIREMKNDFLLYGTPWHGDVKICSSGSAPLKKVFFLKHASRNYLVRLNNMEACSRLLVRMFPPLWSHSGMEYTLALSTRLTRVIPCFELGFVADKSALEFIRSYI